MGNAGFISSTVPVGNTLHPVCVNTVSLFLRLLHYSMNNGIKYHNTALIIKAPALWAPSFDPGAGTKVVVVVLWCHHVAQTLGFARGGGWLFVIEGFPGLGLGCRVLRFQGLGCRV